VLAANEDLEVRLLSIEPHVVESINQDQINRKYFPSLELRPSLRATLDKEILTQGHIIFMAIPSVETVRYLRDNKELLSERAIIVNLAKGFGENKKTIIESLKEIIPNPICSMKGPSFARDIMNDQHTGFTLASEDKALYPFFLDIFEGTTIHLDFTEDVIGAEILSILKNIYAIVLGIVDAHFNSPNLRFMVLTRAFNEMREIMLQFGGKERTLFNYCGYGDFSLTALNDLSRNSTLGLLIGKGFFVQDISDKVILEGKIAVNIFCEALQKSCEIKAFPIIYELYRVFNNHYDLSEFTQKILSNGEE
jgi:glycerol-3-phosphate dehydrogenase (NAD(P)+)